MMPVMLRLSAGISLQMTEQKHLAAALRQMQIRVLPFRQKQKANILRLLLFRRLSVEQLVKQQNIK